MVNSKGKGKRLGFSCDIETGEMLSTGILTDRTVILKDGPVEPLTAVMMQHGRSIAPPRGYSMQLLARIRCAHPDSDGSDYI